MKRALSALHLVVVKRPLQWRRSRRDGELPQGPRNDFPAEPPPVRGHPGGRHRAGVRQRVLGQQGGRHLRRRGLGRAAVRLDARSSTADAAGRASPSRSSRATSSRDEDREPRDDQDRGPLEPTGTAISAMSSTTARPKRGACATASTRPPCASSPTRTSRPRGTASTGSSSTAPPRGRRWPDERHDRQGDPGRRVLLGDAGPHPEAPRRALDPGGLHRRRRGERDLPEPRDPRRGDRDHLRPGTRPPTASCSSSSSRSTTRRR